MGDVLSWEGWRWLTLAACGFGLLASLAFIVTYQVRVGWEWTRNPFGRFLMVRAALLTALFTLIFTNRFLPAWEGRIALTAVLMSAYAIQAVVPYRLLMKVQDRATEDKLEAR